MTARPPPRPTSSGEAARRDRRPQLATESRSDRARHAALRRLRRSRSRVQEFPGTVPIDAINQPATARLATTLPPGHEHPLPLDLGPRRPGIDRQLPGDGRPAERRPGRRSRVRAGQRPVGRPAVPGRQLGAARGPRHARPDQDANRDPGQRRPGPDAERPRRQTGRRHARDGQRDRAGLDRRPGRGESRRTSRSTPTGLDIDQDVELIPVDNVGDRLTPVDVEPPTAHVTIAVFKQTESRPLPVTPVVSGAPAAGYEVTGIAVEPARSCRSRATPTRSSASPRRRRTRSRSTA